MLLLRQNVWGVWWGDGEGGGEAKADDKQQVIFFIRVVVVVNSSWPTLWAKLKFASFFHSLLPPLIYFLFAPSANIFLFRAGNNISFPQQSPVGQTWQSTTSGNVYTVPPPLVEIDQPPAQSAPWAPPNRSWAPPNRSWAPANDGQPVNQPDFDPSAPQEKGEREIYLKPPSYNDALTM